MKRLVALLWTAAFLASLCACGESTPVETNASAGGTLPAPTVPATMPDPFAFGDVNYTLHMPVYEMVSGTVLGEPYYEYRDFCYNEKGQLISKFDGAMDETLLYEYDEQGRLITEITRDADGGDIAYHYTYYDTPYHYVDTRHHQGHRYNFGLIKHCYRTSDYEYWEGATWDYQFEFNEQGQVSKQICEFRFPVEQAYGPTYQAYSKEVTEYEYNAQGLISHEVSVDYFEGDTSESEYRYTYDSAGRVIQVDSMLFPSYEDYPSYYTDTFEYDVVATREISTRSNPELLTTDQWKSFPELFSMPMPDSCVDTIAYVERAENTAAIVYTYTLPGRQQEANEEYYKFQQILTEVCGFASENHNDMRYIYNGGQLVSLMMAGNDPELGYFVQVSFPAVPMAVAPAPEAVAFTNKYGTPDTVCVHRGCSSYIASTGDTNCCEEHSNACLNCGCYIDGDAMYCMACLESSIG